MLNLSPKELNAITKIRGITGYKSISEDRLLGALKAPESLKEIENNFDDKKSKINFLKSRIEEIRKKFYESRHKFFKSKINKIRRYLYKIENAKNLSASKKKKKIEKN